MTIPPAHQHAEKARQALDQVISRLLAARIVPMLGLPVEMAKIKADLKRARDYIDRALETLGKN